MTDIEKVNLINSVFRLISHMQLNDDEELNEKLRKCFIENDLETLGKIYKQYEKRLEKYYS